MTYSEIQSLSNDLSAIQPVVLQKASSVLGRDVNEASLHGILGGKNATHVNSGSTYFSCFEEFFAYWLDAMYNDYLRVGGKARAAQELIRRTDKKQIDSLLQQLELSHKTQERLRELIDRMEKEIVREKVKNDELIGKLNLLQSANVKDLTPEQNKAVNHTKGHNRTL